MIMAVRRYKKQFTTKLLSPKHGFSLLEVMVALALLAITFTSLILVQARATRLANEARNISIATQLARYQMMECKNEVKKVVASVSDFNSEGDFESLGYENFKWECHAPKFNMKPPSASQVEENIKGVAKEQAKKDIGGSASVSAPFIGMITDALGDSVRELSVIIRWTDNAIEDEMRVVTHVIDLQAMSNLSRMLDQGAKTLEKNMPGKKEEKPGEKGAEGTPPGPPGGPPTGGGAPPPPGGP